MARKSIRSKSSGTPGPRSRTLIVAVSPTRSRPISIVVSSGAWRIALRTTFSTARRKSSGWPLTLHEPEIMTSSEHPFASASTSQSSIRPSSKIVERQNFEVVGRWISLGARQLQQFIDEYAQPADIALDARKVFGGDFAGAGQIDGDVESSQRGAQFMRNILQQPALGRQQGFDAAGHFVERARELADLVLARRMGLRGQLASAELVHQTPQSAQGRDDVGREDPGHERDHQHDRPIVGQDVGMVEPGLDDRDEAIVPVARRTDEDHPAVGQARRSVSEAISLQQRGPVGAGDQIAAALVGQEVLARKIAIDSAYERGELLRASFFVGVAEIVFDHLEKVRERVALGRTASVEGP